MLELQRLDAGKRKATTTSTPLKKAKKAAGKSKSMNPLPGHVPLQLLHLLPGRQYHFID
jgi:hypothetical protein